MIQENIQWDEIEMQKKFQVFLDKYGTKYMSDALHTIKENFGQNLERPPFDIMSQVYAALQALPEKYNYYNGVMEDLEKTFGIDRHIVEIGGGMYPAFAELVDQKQRKIKKGTITVYDPYLVPDKLGSIHLIKECFQMDTRLDNADLLVGLLPCQQTIPMVEKANHDHLEFYILMCGCTHFPNDYYMNYLPITEAAWHNYVYEVADRTKESTASLEVGYLPDQYEMPYPIIKKKYKQKK